MGGGGFIGGLVDTIANVATMGAYGQHKAQKEAQKAQEQAQAEALRVQQKALAQQEAAAKQQQEIQKQQIEMTKQQQLQTERQNQAEKKANATTAISNRVNSKDYSSTDLTRGNVSKAIIGKDQLEELNDDEEWY